VRTIAQLPQSTELDNAHADESGSVYTFGSTAEIPGFNDGGGFWQLYRYSVADDELACVSCPAHGQVPVGNAEASYSNARIPAEGSDFGYAHSTLDTRVLSDDGSRVFFDSPNALVPAASNGKRNVYEWEDGSLYLISPGTSGENDHIMGSSASGNDVFFATSAGLVPGDADGAYDVYDARIPHPGDVLPPEALPCEGSVCQGPPSTPQLLSPPASASFSGQGNLLPSSPAQPSGKHKRLTRKPRRKHGAKRTAARRGGHRHKAGRTSRRRGRARQHNGRTK
jgi:hypothetical protein